MKDRKKEDGSVYFNKFNERAVNHHKVILLKFLTEVY